MVLVVVEEDWEEVLEEVVASVVSVVSVEEAEEVEDWVVALVVVVVEVSAEVWVEAVVLAVEEDLEAALAALLQVEGVGEDLVEGSVEEIQDAGWEEEVGV